METPRTVDSQIMKRSARVLVRSIVPFLLLSLCASSCRTASSRLVMKDRAEDWPTFEASDELDPYRSPTWKECLPDSYVFIEHVGDPRELGSAMRILFDTARSSELAVSGAPFALFYDDPGKVPLAEQRSRACLPIQPGTQTPSGLSLDHLPSRMVVFQRQAGPYTDAPLVVPSLMGYLNKRGWRPAGPVREVYLVNPGDVAAANELVCEVQVPWTTGS